MTENKRLLGWGLEGILDNTKIAKTYSAQKKVAGVILVASSSSSIKSVTDQLPGGIPAWQLKDLAKKKNRLFQLTSDSGPVVLVRLGKQSKASNDFGFHGSSLYQNARDHGGVASAHITSSDCNLWTVIFDTTSEDSIVGFLAGLEMGSYRFKKANEEGALASVDLRLVGCSKDQVGSAKVLGRSVNIARHLVNTPPNILNPASFAQAAKKLFTGNKAVKTEVWSGERLKKEKMGLMIGVGGAATEGPRLVHIRYRPPGAKGSPIAFVGKGITFDSGGLDLKPSAGMRLMKKDMGGAASVLGIAYWAIQAKLKKKLDFYLALAENAVDAKAYRPGDVLTSRNGMTVEIHNTDAEGRLVLADAIDVAISQKGSHKPGLLVNIATLTGAARVGLGTGVGALFATDTQNQKDVAIAGQKYGDHMWPMPLYEPYQKTIRSNFADTNHCSTSRFGGAITAALFLKKFVGDTPFVHLDVMGWADVGGVYRESGGNGQAVQCFAKFLSE